MNQTDIALAIFFSILFSVVLLGGMAMIAYTAHRTRLRHQLKLSQAQTEYEQELRQVAGEVQEQILSNLSGELHDNIGQRLTLVHFQLEAQRSNAHPELLQQANQNLIEAMKEVRLLSHSLSADVLRRQGLFSLIAQEAKRLAQNGHLHVRFQNPTDSEPLLGADQQLMAFRLFQEAVNNALKHAHAQNLYIMVQAEPEFLLEISDDGRGFDMSLLKTHGAGLQNMQQRALLAGLHCTIVSTPGKGCSVRLKRAA